MTKKWFLIEGANRNMSIAMTCADAINAVNQLSEEPRWNTDRIESSIESGRKFLENFAAAVESLYRSDVLSDPFLFSLADETARSIGVRPRRLFELTRKAISDLSEKVLSPESYKLLTVIIKITQQAAVHKCESIKPLIL